MSLQHIDIESAMRRLADRRIEDAMRAGKVDNLKGVGEPLELDPAPAEESARMTWCCLRILKNNDFTPDEIRYRKAIDHLKGSLAQASTEQRVRTLVDQINDLVHKLNTLGTNAINLGIAPLCLDTELTDFQTRQARSNQPR
ncbi:MAG TPA: DUF1992 domain-containing protein [Tepidisphaeraceae bacterium]|jgi:hypothetical protein